MNAHELARHLITRLSDCCVKQWAEPSLAVEVIAEEIDSWLRARQAPAPAEVSRLACEIKMRALNAASLPRDPQPRTLQLRLHDEAVERLASMASTPVGEVLAGWKLVPIEPTDLMIEQGFDQIDYRDLQESHIERI